MMNIVQPLGHSKMFIVGGLGGGMGAVNGGSNVSNLSSYMYM